MPKFIATYTHDNGTGHEDSIVEVTTISLEQADVVQAKKVAEALKPFVAIKYVGHEHGEPAPEVEVEVRSLDDYLDELDRASKVVWETRDEYELCAGCSDPLHQDTINWALEDGTLTTGDNSKPWCDGCLPERPAEED